MKKSKILLIEDDELFCQTLLAEVKRETDFIMDVTRTLADAHEKLAAEYYDIVLLDITLPDGNGIEFCSQLREKKNAIPIIVLTAHEEDGIQVTGLDAGANDYITKPVKLQLLLARIRNQLRQHQQNTNAAFPIGPYLFQQSEKKLLIEGQRPILLTDKETAILRYLLQAKDNTANRDELLANVWGYNSGVTTHTLETHIYRLRKKIEIETDQPLIITERGGYRLLA